MSGGHFDYAQHKITDIASEVEDMIENNWREFTPATIASFRTSLFFLRTAAVYAQRIDWLVSGDDGEETFLQRLHDDLRSEIEALEDPLEPLETVHCIIRNMAFAKEVEQYGRK